MLILYLEATCFSIAQLRLLFHLYFSNQIEFDLKRTNQEFLLFFKLQRNILHNISHIRLMNYEFKSMPFVNLAFNI